MSRWLLTLLLAFWLFGCAPNAQEPKQAAPLTCARELEQLTKRLYEAQRCETAQDCIDAYYLPCPFPCAPVLNLQLADVKELVRAMRAYGARCDTCAYRCKPLDATRPLLCDQGLCRR